MADMGGEKGSGGGEKGDAGVNNWHRRIILASSSPRRIKVLSRAIPGLVIVHPDVEEVLPEGQVSVEDVRRWVVENARKKALSVPRDKGDIVVAMDTVVFADGRLVGKPDSMEHAEEMLRGFSGGEQVVVTGIVVVSDEGVFSDTEETTLKFRELSGEEIRSYLSTGEWAGRAGGYAIQGRGGDLIERVDGSRANVAGVSVDALRRLLKRAGVEFSPEELSEEMVMKNLEERR